MNDLRHHFIIQRKPYRSNCQQFTVPLELGHRLQVR